MIRRPPISTRTYTLLPDTTLFRCAARPDSRRLRPRGHAVQCGNDRLDARRRVEMVLEPVEGDLHAEIPALNVGWASAPNRSEEHTSELQSLMRISYAVFCLNTKKKLSHIYNTHIQYALLIFV